MKILKTIRIRRKCRNWNNETKRAECAWNCVIFVEAIVNTENSGAVLPKSWNDAAATTGAIHINQMEKKLKSKPEKELILFFMEEITLCF